MSRRVKASRNKAKDVEIKRPHLRPPMTQPNCQEALRFLDFAVGIAPLSRSQHIQAQQAVRQIEQALTELDQLKKLQK